MITVKDKVYVQQVFVKNNNQVYVQARKCP